MTRTNFVDIVKKRVELAKNNQRDKFKRFNDFDYIYNNELKYSDSNIPSKVFNPILWSFIETITVRLLAKPPIIAYIPRTPDDRDNANIHSEIFKYWFQKSNARGELEEWIKNSLIYGTGILKVDWFTDKPRPIYSYITDELGKIVVNQDGNLETQTDFVVDYDDPRIKNVNIYDFFISPNAKDIQDADWVIHQYWIKLEELKNQNEVAKMYGKPAVFNEKALSRLSNSFRTVETTESLNKQDSIDSRVISKDNTVEQVLIHEMWDKNGLTVIANDCELIRKEPNPYWHGMKPFIKIVDSIVPGEFWGRGEIEPVEKLLHALNTTQNQRITNVNRILSPMWVARPGVNDNELQFVDNGVIHVNELTDVNFIHAPNITATAYQESIMIKEDIQRALGVTDYIQGLDTPNQTAREVEIKTAQSNARFSHKISLFEELGLKKLGMFIYKLYQQFMTEERVIKIAGKLGDRWVRISPIDLMGQYDVIPENSSTLSVDEDVEFRKFFNLYSVLRTNPNINGLEFDKELLRKSGQKTPEKFIVEEPQQNVMPIPQNVQPRRRNQLFER